MKKTLFTLATLLCFAFGAVFANDAPDPNDVGDLDRDAAVKAFAQLTENVKKAFSGPEPLVKGPNGGMKFNGVTPVDITTAGGTGVVSGCTNAVKVWFELTNGHYVNPKHYRWAPNEIFYVHVQSAVPVYVTIYQNFPGISESKRAYPDARFPNSFQMIRPGEGTRLPVAFQMDGNYNSEYMSIVVTKADWEGIREEVPHAAVDAVQPETVVASLPASDGDKSPPMLKGGASKEGTEISSESALTKFALINEAGLNNSEYTDGETKCYRLRYWVSYPRYFRPHYYCRYVNWNYYYVPITYSTYPHFVYYRGCYKGVDDASLYLFSENGVGQIQLTFNKCGPSWRW